MRSGKDQYRITGGFYYDKNMKRMTALACAAMMIASMGITGCGKADGQTKEGDKNDSR